MNDSECDHVDNFLLYERFFMVVLFGGTVAVVSLSANTFLFFLFVTNKQHRNSTNLYMLLLAICDVFLSISYIALMVVRVLANWTGSHVLRKLMVSYTVPMLTISHICQTAAVFLITFAALERFYITVSHDSVPVLQRNRPTLAVVAVACGLISKGTIPFEISIKRNDECIGRFNELIIDTGFLVKGNYLYYNEIWRFWFRTLFTVILPFVLLFVLNILLWVQLQCAATSRQGDLVDASSLRQKRARIRAVTRSLFILVLSHLLSNALGFCLAIWEVVDADSLWEKYIGLYTLTVDAVSIFPIIACAARLPIYATCQPLLRQEMRQFASQPLQRFPTSSPAKQAQKPKIAVQPCSHKRMPRRATIIETQQFNAHHTLLSSRQPLNA